MTGVSPFKFVLRVERKLFVIDNLFPLFYLPFFEYAQWNASLLHAFSIWFQPRRLIRLHYELWTSPSEITSKIPMEVEGFEPPQEEDIPIRRPERTRRAPNRVSLNVEAEEQSLGDLNKPTSYKSIVVRSESNKWIDAMNSKNNP
ncbi:hypothetical protein Tco_0445418 [Tanacetum coccineum]